MANESNKEPLPTKGENLTIKIDIIIVKLMVRLEVGYNEIIEFDQVSKRVLASMAS